MTVHLYVVIETVVIGILFSRIRPIGLGLTVRTHLDQQVLHQVYQPVLVRIGHCVPRIQRVQRRPISLVGIGVLDLP